MSNTERVDQLRDGIATSIEKLIVQRTNAEQRVSFAETQLLYIRESCPCEKTRALAAGALETLRAMKVTP